MNPGPPSFKERPAGATDQVDVKISDALADRHRRVWLVVSHDSDGDSRRVMAELEGSFDLVRARDYPQINVLLYERNPRP